MSPTDRSAQHTSVLAAAAAYAERRPALVQATTLFVEMITSQLDEAGINYLSVTGRTKSVESFAAKAERIHPEPLDAITDAIGVRVITYVHDDVAAVAELLAQEHSVLDDRDLGQETAREGRFGYASRHLLVAVDASRELPARFDPLRRLSASVQVRTVLQHAWAEFEHDIRYKGSVPVEHASDLDRRFTLAAGLLELADREFSAIRDRLQRGGGEPDESAAGVDGSRGAGGLVPSLAHPLDGADVDDPRIEARELATFLAGRYTEAGWSRPDHYAWISGLLLELGIASLDELGHDLDGVDSAGVNARMEYQYPPGAVRRLDDDLLARHGERYVGLHGNAHRQEALRTRLAKLGG